MNVSSTPTPTELRPLSTSSDDEVHELASLVRAVEGDDVERCLTAARALVARDARVSIPRLVTHLEERFAALLESGPSAYTADGKTACVALAITLEPLLWRIGDSGWQGRVADLSHRGMFNPTNL